MGNTSSSSLSSQASIESLRQNLHTLYSNVFSEKNLLSTIRPDSFSTLHDQLHKDVFIPNSEIPLELQEQIFYKQDPAIKHKNEILSETVAYYMKKINLVGVIILAVRMAHLKLDRLRNGTGCYGENLLGATTIKTHPIQIGLFSLNIRNNVIKNANISNNELTRHIALIEIDNENVCREQGGSWKEKNVHNGDREYPTGYKKKLDKLELDVYQSISELIHTMEKCIEERIEPRMIDGKEHRVKVFRDRVIYNTDLDTCSIKAKKLLQNLFVKLDSFYLASYSFKPKSRRSIKSNTRSYSKIK
jgi:hypothetical protein